MSSDVERMSQNIRWSDQEDPQAWTASEGQSCKWWMLPFRIGWRAFPALIGIWRKGWRPSPWR
jgi:hypothetical protein